MVDDEEISVIPPRPAPPQISCGILTIHLKGGPEPLEKRNQRNHRYET